LILVTKERRVRKLRVRNSKDTGIPYSLRADSYVSFEQWIDALQCVVAL